MALDDNRVKSKTELLKSHAKEQVKQHLVFDAQDRPVLVFTAPIDAIDGAPCEVTEYVYRNPTSTQVLKRQERVYNWNENWDTGFTFDPATDYDPDGDGEL